MARIKTFDGGDARTVLDYTLPIAKAVTTTGTATSCTYAAASILATDICVAQMGTVGTAAYIVGTTVAAGYVSASFNASPGEGTCYFLISHANAV
jgi:hypothetical protein